MDGNNNNNSFGKLRNSANTNTNNSNTNENTKRNINNLKNYVKNQLKENNNYNLESGIKIKDIKDMTNKGSQSNGERMRNYKDFSLKNTKTKYSADGKESKIRNIDEQLINLNQYKDKINTSKDFKCKFCLKSFSFPEYKEHFNICLKNPMNANNSITRNNYYKRNNNNDFISSNSNTNSNNNRKNSNNKLNNSNLNNNENTNKKYISINKDNNRKYININYENINNIRIDTNNTSENITYKINNSINNKNNNINNINIKINNQNININKNLININSIKKITNNIHLNNYVKNTKNTNITNLRGNIINNVNLNNISNNKNIDKITNINHSYYANNNNSSNNNNKRNNYSISPISTFNPAKMKLKIIKGRIRKDKAGKPYLEYIIEINYLNKKWQINKRFNQFTNLYKNIKLNANQGGPELPQSANIFSNIGSLFSGLSHENKIIQLEKFLKDITETDGINNSTAYKNFFLMDQIINEYKGRNSKNKKNENQNKDKQSYIDNKIVIKTYSNKNSTTNSAYHVYNNTGGYTSNNIDNKFNKIQKDIFSYKGNKKIIIKKV